MRHETITSTWPGMALALLATSSLLGGSLASAATPQPMLGNQTVSSITLSTQAGAFHHPLDSTPDVSGKNIYFTANGPQGAGVFRVPTSGGKAVAAYVGAPFVHPRAIAIGPHSGTILVTDAVAGKSGQIFALTPGAMSPSTLAGSAGTSPENLTIVIQSGQEMVYFSGKDPDSGQPAVLRLPISGASKPEIVAEGGPLKTPDGLAVTRSGIVYVADRTAAGHGLGRVFRVSGGQVTPILSPVRAGNPAGVALTRDDAVLLVSALQLHRASDQVVLIDLTTLHTGSVTKVIAQNSGAGGVHAQPFDPAQTQTSNQPQLFSWADFSPVCSPHCRPIAQGAVYAITVG